MGKSLRFVPVVLLLCLSTAAFRAQEAERPGSLRVVAALDGRPLPEQPFAQVDSASAELSKAPVMGELRSVDVGASSRRPVQADVAYYDPSCIEQCDQQYYTCLEWCGPGDGDVRSRDECQ